MNCSLPKYLATTEIELTLSMQTDSHSMQKWTKFVLNQN